VSFTEIFQILWPIAVTLIPIVLGAGFLWLKTQFPTKADLDQAKAEAKAAVQGLEGEVEALERDVAGRFERGSRKFGDHDKRLAVVEKECEGAPTKADLTQMISVLAGRMSGVESSLKGVEKLLGTQHDYLRAVIEGKGGK